MSYTYDKGMRDRINRQMDRVRMLGGMVDESVSTMLSEVAMNNGEYYKSGAFENRDHGYTAVRRKILLLRQELKKLDNLL